MQVHIAHHFELTLVSVKPVLSLKDAKVLRPVMNYSTLHLKQLQIAVNENKTIHKNGSELEGDKESRIRVKSQNFYSFFSADLSLFLEYILLWN